MDTQEQASPQEQAMYDAVATSARGIIFGEQSFKMVLEKLTSSPNPGESIGHTAAMVLRSVESGIKKKGKQVPPDVLIAASDDVITDLVDIAEASKMIEKEQEGEIAKQALDEAVKVLTQKPGQPPPEAMPQSQPPQPPQPQGLVGQVMMGA